MGRGDFRAGRAPPRRPPAAFRIRTRARAHTPRRPPLSPATLRQSLLLAASRRLPAAGLHEAGPAHVRPVAGGAGAGPSAARPRGGWRIRVWRAGRDGRQALIGALVELVGGGAERSSAGPVRVLLPQQPGRLPVAAAAPGRPSTGRAGPAQAGPARVSSGACPLSTFLLFPPSRGGRSREPRMSASRISRLPRRPARLGEAVLPRVPWRGRRWGIETRSSNAAMLERCRWVAVAGPRAPRFPPPLFAVVGSLPSLPSSRLG